MRGRRKKKSQKSAKNTKCSKFMSRKPIKEKLYLRGIPRDKVGMVEEAVDVGLMLAREHLSVNKAVTVKVVVIERADKIRGDVISMGRTSKRSVTIGLRKKFLYSREALRKITGTVVHEYAHFIRLHSGRHNAKTVLGTLIEEGIAIYVQTVLAGPPEYLDIKRLNKKEVDLYWHKFSPAINELSKNYPQIERDDAYRTIGYRLGFSIVKKSMKSNPATTLSRLIRTPTKKLAVFAKQNYGNY